MGIVKPCSACGMKEDGAFQAPERCPKSAEPGRFQAKAGLAPVLLLD